MVKIVEATKEEIKKFNKKEWRGADIEHYGRVVNWKEREFIFKAIENGKIVGTITGKYEAGVLHISAIIVAKEKRNRGIGKKLIQKAESFGKKLRAHKIHLITGKNWKDTNKFYNSLGFKKVADLPKHFLKQDFTIFEKFI